MTESNKRQKTKQAIEDLYGTIASRTAFLPNHYCKIS